MPIDEKKWSSDRFISLVAGVAKELVLNSYEETETEILDKKTDETKKIPCVKFSVGMEDGKTVDKEWSVTSRGLVKQLIPLVKETIDKNAVLKLNVTQFGSGYKTYYEVKKV